MDITLLAFVIVSPLACVLLTYKFLNHGKDLCIDTSNIDNLKKVAVENV